VREMFRHYDSRTLPRFHALGYAYPKHSNADGMALAALREILVREETAAGASRPYVLMISDGQPAASGYGGSSAFQHVAGEVRRLTAAGIAFAHLQIGDAAAPEAMNAMSRPDQLPERIASLALKWFGGRAADKTRSA
jgi:hypothetical protein